MLRGSCCCEAVKFELSAPPSMMAMCHCSRCRKVGASVFVFTARAHFTLTQGADQITVYEPEAGQKYRRCFCAVCGTALGELIGEGESFPIPANCFDDPLDLSIRFHEFVAEKPDWLAICDGAKQFAHHPVKG